MKWGYLWLCYIPAIGERSPFEMVTHGGLSHLAWDATLGADTEADLGCRKFSSTSAHRHGALAGCSCRTRVAPQTAAKIKPGEKPEPEYVTLSLLVQCLATFSPTAMCKITLGYSLTPKYALGKRKANVLPDTTHWASN